MPRKKTLQEVKNEFGERGYILLDNEYINNKKKMRYICKKHPNEVQEMRYNCLKSGVKCKYCATEKTKEKQKLTYDEVQKEFMCRGYVLLEKKYINALTPMKFKCFYHPDKDTKINLSNLKSGSGCYYCGREKTNNSASNRRLTAEEVDKRFSDRGYVWIKEKYKNCHQDLKYKCPNHPDIINTTNMRRIINGHGCPLCNESKGEKKIRRILEKNKIPSISQKRFEGLLGIKGRELSYDFFIQKYNLLIEYQGEYHDGTARNQTKDQYKKQKEHDERKRNYAKQNNIKLLEIWYWDFHNIEEILSNQLNIHKKELVNV